MSTDTGLMHRIEPVMARTLDDYVTALREQVPGIGAASIEVAGGVAAFTGGPVLAAAVRRARGRHSAR